MPHTALHSNSTHVVSDDRATSDRGLMPWTYIIECRDHTYYVGSTIDLDRRIEEHNLGFAAKYTRPSRRRPVTLRWAAEFDRVEHAFQFEKQIQGWGREKRRALIEGRIADLPALARGRSNTS